MTNQTGHYNIPLNEDEVSQPRHLAERTCRELRQMGVLVQETSEGSLGWSQRTKLGRVGEGGGATLDT